MFWANAKSANYLEHAHPNGGGVGGLHGVANSAMRWPHSQFCNSALKARNSRPLFRFTANRYLDSTNLAGGPVKPSVAKTDHKSQATGELRQMTLALTAHVTNTVLTPKLVKQLQYDK